MFTRPISTNARPSHQARNTRNIENRRPLRHDPQLRSETIKQSRQIHTDSECPLFIGDINQIGENFRSGTTFYAGDVGGAIQAAMAGDYGGYPGVYFGGG
jgi:hypothetical protein